jgi:glycosyltransferase involved in cell wall biosynthesis
MAGFGENGTVFPVDDARALADAILSLARDRSRLAFLSEACQIRFTREFTAAAMTARTEALYQTLLPPDAIP